MLARAIPLAILVLAGLYIVVALKLPLGTMSRPGAAFFPLLVGVFAVIVGAGSLVTARTATPVARGEAELDAPARRRRVAVSVLALVGFCALVPWAGYPVTAVVFVAVVLRYLGASWVGAITMGVVSAAASYGLFGILLDVPLPRGPW